MKRFNIKGIALFELLTAMPLYGLLSLVLTMAMMHFVIQYNETQDFITLQNDLYSTMDALRVGYVDEKTDEMPMMGIASADSVFFGYDGSLTIAPADYDPIRSEYSTFKLASATGELLVSGRNYKRSAQNPIPVNFNNKRIFPRREEKIGNDFKYQVLSFNAKNANPPNYNWGSKTWLVELNIEAQVRFRKKERNQSRQQDLDYNTRSIKYSTKIFLGNLNVN